MPHGRPAVSGDDTGIPARPGEQGFRCRRDRKSTRLNSSHSQISYAVFCLKKKNSRPGGAARRSRPLAGHLCALFAVVTLAPVRTLLSTYRGTIPPRCFSINPPLLLYDVA